MERFDESEVREIALDDRNYLELLSKIEKPPKVLRYRGNLLPNRKIIALSGSRKTTQAALDAAYRIGRMLAQHGYTIVDGLARGCDRAATEGALSGGGNVIGVVPQGLKSLQGHTKRLAKKIFAAGGTVLSEYPDDLAEISNWHYLRRDTIITGLAEKTIIVAAEEREVIITRYVKAKIKGATIVRNLRELKDALGVDREGLRK